jgi:hypothetical protein
MRIIGLTILVAVLAAARPAAAQPLDQQPQSTSATIAGATHGTGIGVGVAAMLTGGPGTPFPGGLSVAYDAGPWHLDSIFGLQKGDGGGMYGRRPSFILGGRFWFHQHKTANSDFSVGGGLAFMHDGPARQQVISLEAGGQLRAFLASNVALAFSAGLGIDTIDRSRVQVGGQFVTTAAVHYYFY